MTAAASASAGECSRSPSYGEPGYDKHKLRLTNAHIVFADIMPTSEISKSGLANMATHDIAGDTL